MQTTAQQLSLILGSGLLGPSLSELAATLGYRGRSTLYRIARGTASENALLAFCDRLSSHLFISADILGAMRNAILNASSFTRLVRPRMVTDHPRWQLMAILPFLLDDYTNFSPDFRDATLPEILRLRQSDPDAFYQMLAWFYIHSGGSAPYLPGRPHREQCAAIMEALGRQLIDIFPENLVAARFVYIYSRTEVFSSEAPIPWSLVTSLATMFQFFASTDTVGQGLAETILLPGTGERNYWRSSASDSTILSFRSNADQPGTGAYQIFTVDPSTARVVNVCLITFHPDNVLTLRINHTGYSCVGLYSWDGQTLTFQWEIATADPTGLGNRWTIRPLAASQSLRRLDRAISSESLLREALRADGMEFLPDYEITDVSITRTSLTLHLAGGITYTIPLDQASFLATLRPSDPVGIVRRSSDGLLHVFWPAIMHSLPLSAFTPAP